ncbi:MAG: acyltransferase [Verrucomicrobiota bacterium]|nr:acyltransferase [Verrucomicrobiota bacterium]
MTASILQSRRPLSHSRLSHGKPVYSQAESPSITGWLASREYRYGAGAHCTVIRDFPVRLHPWFKWIFDGDLGVRCFFLISGLLITWLLLREREERGTINLRHFYVRRALRILPAYYAFLLTIALLSLLTPFKQRPSAWITNFTFTTDFLVNGEWTTGHLWSLAVEEQFYLLWPGLLLLSIAFDRKHKKQILILIFVTALTLAPVSRAISYVLRRDASGNPFASAFSFFNYFDSIAIGCACAFVLIHKAAWLQNLRSYAAHWTSAALSLIAIPYILGRLFIGGKIILPLGPSMEGVGLSVLVLQSIASPKKMPYGLLNFPLVRFVGVLSYSLYIWQMIFCTDPHAFGLSRAWWLGFPAWLASAFVTACLSYFGFERPLLKLRRKFRDIPRRDEQFQSTREH